MVKVARMFKSSAPLKLQQHFFALLIKVAADLQTIAYQVTEIMHYTVNNKSRQNFSFNFFFNSAKGLRPYPFECRHSRIVKECIKSS